MSFLKNIFGRNETAAKPQISSAEKRVQKMRARLDAKRAESFNRDSAIRGNDKISSARDYLARSLGKAEGSKYGTSVGRLNKNANGSASPNTPRPTLPPTLPPKLPPIRPRT
ncbi:hypothetical protein KKF59_02345 [Patescibacteria group bacterium]|nr:hypothetical protein [Patescibacteria group bacterium]MBU1629709.1 hypothetical protein [Patescibacteria group bacterium]MBU1907950.1 hypothetical protein [Patescibacteria group bacterium]